MGRVRSGRDDLCIWNWCASHREGIGGDIRRLVMRPALGRWRDYWPFAILAVFFLFGICSGYLAR